MFYTSGCEQTILDDQREFFREVSDEDGDFVNGRVVVDKTIDFKTPANVVRSRMPLRNANSFVS